MLISPSAFILFRSFFQAQVAAQNPGLANPGISQIIGKMWNELSDESKKEWRQFAEVCGDK
jgi:RuvB-like protein 1 (pontin 52)/HMG box factor